MAQVNENSKQLSKNQINPSIDYERWIVKDGDFTFMQPTSIECGIVTCKNYESCRNVGTGILPIAKSILEVFGLDWQLPGHGSKYDDCGDWRYRGCTHVEDHFGEDLEGHTHEGKIFVEWYHRSCYRAVCPVCYEKWAALEAKKIAHKLEHLWKFGKVIHVAISPSEKDVLNLPFEKLRSKMYQIAQSRGIKGGSAIWHPWRENDDGTWRFSPHFHVLGFGWVKNVVDGYKKDGWLVKNIQDGKDERSVFRTAMYQLSHCGIDTHGKKRPVSWFGVCSSAGKNRIKIPAMEREKHLCPSCEAELVQLRYTGDPGLLPVIKKEGSGWLDPGGWNEKTEVKWHGT